MRAGALEFSIRQGHGNQEAIKELNQYLDTMAQMVFQAKRTLLDFNKLFSAQAIKDLMTGVAEKLR